ncbi:hypothetical protein GCM10011418_37160 [Sphingobacterium alkalisoli]|nr:hypothetical protein GCM10011418_37160 [Sphingobacterium alkalisoli]
MRLFIALSLQIAKLTRAQADPTLYIPLYRNLSTYGGAIFDYASKSGKRLRLDYHNFGKSNYNNILHFHTNFGGRGIKKHRSLIPFRFGKAIEYK